ncbi:hypothetical protein P153DRAFT_303454 [Dothidotthia symphoricarpi CBS 119687]|uniref:Uncharacterized protein n=1 Tax=Dothidotthia symphoricarpi CBS 119687 TaxID=1392245 RepID=A0A6A5ZX23_9PLEO|nr:uncharacterized protein P153DRAFT_303454 [Dothidotthia symphoricarpi CBS 119687]KAF2123846.1 hypothetical protein P153DRAFT_303454 [Dothidotthia symphoricarpi CBS 119687]
MTDRVAKPRARKKKPVTLPPNANVQLDDQLFSSSKDPIRVKSEPPERDGELFNVHVPFPTSPRTTAWSIDAQKAVVAIRYQYKPPSLYQPVKVQTDALDMAFLSHFVELNRGVSSYSPEIPWLTYLPVANTIATKATMKFAIRAASMAFYAIHHHDPSILVDSYRWYNVSLSTQRLSLARLTGESIPDEEQILAPIVLALYEVYVGTTSSSVMHHLAAAAELIKMRGPTNCSSGVIWPLFKAMRVSDAHKSLIFNVPSTFCSPEWMTLPFLNMPRNAHQDLVEVILHIPHCIRLCYTRGGSLRTFFATPIPAHTDRQPCRTRTLTILAELRAWAARFPHLTSISPSPHEITADMASLCVNGVTATHPDSKTLVVPHSFLALTAATYQATLITLTLLLRKLDMPVDPLTPQSPDVDDAAIEQATKSAKSVLHIAASLESTRPIGFDFMRSVFPVVVVAILGPGDEEMVAAREMLKRWGDSRGMGGLCGAWLDIR